jgi:hypothetical protein
LVRDPCAPALKSRFHGKGAAADFADRGQQVVENRQLHWSFTLSPLKPRRVSEGACQIAV